MIDHAIYITKDRFSCTPILFEENFLVVKTLLKNKALCDFDSYLGDVRVLHTIFDATYDSKLHV